MILLWIESIGKSFMGLRLLKRSGILLIHEDKGGYVLNVWTKEETTSVTAWI